MTAPDTDHAAAIRQLCQQACVSKHPTIQGFVVGQGRESMNATLDMIRDRSDALQHERNEAREALAASEARCGRYRAALESEFAYNMLAIVQQYADPKRTAMAAEAALAAWQELRRHNDPIIPWPGYQPGDLPEEGEVTT